MKILFHKKFQKFIRKIKNKELFSLIKNEVDKIIKEPSSGKILEHPFRKYHILSVSFSYDKNSFRIAYILNKDELIFLLIDSRENFYKKLERII
jgi:mRNA-degrading endonuclease RelE of RelBE toxin-antitoxin system